jgi:phage shock protein PspC (stress-responsive transcriptional regulator)
MTEAPAGEGSAESQEGATGSPLGYPPPPYGYAAAPQASTWAPPPPGSTPPPPVAPRRLVRSVDNRMIAGVAGGLGAYLGIDALLVRIAFVAASFLGGMGVVAYVAAWLLVPSADSSEPVGLTAARRLGEGRGRGRTVVGAVLLAVAAIILADNLSAGHGGLFWGLGLIVVGVLLLAEEAWPSRASGPAAAGQAAPPAAYPASTYAAAFAPTPAWTPPAAAPAPAVPMWSTRPPAARASPRRPRSILGWVTVAVALLAVGTAALLDNAGVVSVTVGAALALALIVVGLGLIAGAWFGRSRALIVLGIALIPLAATAALIQVPISGGAGDRTVTPLTATDLQGEYRLGAGQLTLDLTGLDLGGGSRTVTASVALGQLSVVVPRNVTVDAHGQVGAGQLDLLGHVVGGARVETTATSAGSPGGGTLHLDLKVGLGQVRVVQAGTLGATP